MPKPTCELHIALSVDTLKKLEALMLRTESYDMGTLIRRAIALYDLVNEHQDCGGRLIFEHANGEQEPLTI